MIGFSSATVRLTRWPNTESNLRGLGGREERLGILTEFTWSGVGGCRAWMQFHAKLAEDAADACEAGDGGAREPPGVEP